MRKQDKERRAEQRSPIRAKVRYLFESPDCEKEKVGPWESFTVDISYRGMGLYAECPAQVGQKVEIILQHVFEDPVIGEVKWCRKEVNNLYKVGIQYC